MWLEVDGHVDARTPDAGMTMLIGASLNGRAPLVSALIEKKADVDAQAADGTTALMAASCAEDGGACMQLLLNAGANVVLTTKGIDDVAIKCARGAEIDREAALPSHHPVVLTWRLPCLAGTLWRRARSRCAASRRTTCGASRSSRVPR